MTSPIMPTPPNSDPSVSMVGVDVSYSRVSNTVSVGIYTLDYRDVDVLKAFIDSVYPRMRAGRQEELRTTPPYDYKQLERLF